MQSRLAPKRTRSFHHICCSYDPLEAGERLSLVGFLKRALLAVCFTCFTCFICFICIACSIQTWSKRNAGDHKGRYCVASPGNPLRIRSILHLPIPTVRP